MFGLISCAPLIILLAVHTIVYFATGSYIGVGAIAGVIYLMFFVFFRLDASTAAGGAAEESAATTVSLPWYAYYGTLIALPIVMTMTGVFYILGARKIKLQQKMIKEKQRQIYGDSL